MAELTARLGGELLAEAGQAANAEDGARAVAEAITSGAAAERFGQMVYAMGGPVKFVENWRRFLPEASVIREVPAPVSGVVTQMQSEALGLCVVRLGGGRQVQSDVVDPAVGLSDVVRIGTKVTKGQPLARVHAARETLAEAAISEVQAAIVIGQASEAAPLPLVVERISA
ncbi:Thymidine phosphorylase [Nymphon striatum]|nr:Thymidine phosphorylase [Nymphon striatum]